MYNRQAVPWIYEERINRELGTAERTEWMERPIPRFFTVRSTVPFIFAIPWTAFAIFWIFGAAGFKFPDFSEGFPSFFPLFGVPFVLIGIAMLGSPIWNYRQALRTVYVITDKRAIIFKFGRSTTIRSFAPGELTPIYRKERADGSGDVIFSAQGQEERFNRQEEGIGFFAIREPREVEKMLRELAQKQGS